jgi:hypothetical protein
VGLFGSKPVAGPLPLDVLTPEYLISGQVETAAQEWVWSYFSTVAKRPARALEMTVTGAQSTGGRPAPTLNGSTAAFAYGTALIAVIPRDPAGDALWDEWATVNDQTAAGELLVGPYAVSGSFLTGSDAMSAVINDRLAARDVTFTRIDGSGAWGPVQASRAVIATGLLQFATVAGAPLQ